MKFHQGDIIVITLDPRVGHEQSGRRPALVVSSDKFNRYTEGCYVCPITNTMKDFPMHVPFDKRTETTGCILCEQMRFVDVKARSAIKKEDCPQDILETVLAILHASLCYRAL